MTFYPDKHTMIVTLMMFIPISFNMYKTLYENYYSIEMGRSIFSTDEVTDKSNRHNITRSTQCKEDIGYNCTTRKAKTSDI